MQYVFAKVNESGLSDAERLFLDACRAQSLRLAMNLQARGDLIVIQLAGPDPDTVRLNLSSIDGLSERSAAHVDHGSVWNVPERAIDFARNGAFIAALAFCAESMPAIDNVWIHPSWITHAEAAKLIGASNTTGIRNAVRDGRLVTWYDWREKNPQRRGRVWSAQVLARLGAQNGD